MVFRATTNNTGENGDKKQNTLPYTLQVKVVEVCLVGAGERCRSLHATNTVKTHIFMVFSGIFGCFSVIFYPLPEYLLGFNFVLTSALS